MFTKGKSSDAQLKHRKQTEMRCIGSGDTRTNTHTWASVVSTARAPPQFTLAYIIIFFFFTHPLWIGGSLLTLCQVLLILVPWINKCRENWQDELTSTKAITQSWITYFKVYGFLFRFFFFWTPLRSCTLSPRLSSTLSLVFSVHYPCLLCPPFFNKSFFSLGIRYFHRNSSQ